MVRRLVAGLVWLLAACDPMRGAGDPVGGDDVGVAHLGFDVSRLCQNDCPGGLRCEGGAVYADPPDQRWVQCGPLGFACLRGPVVHTCRDGCTSSYAQRNSPAALCRDGGPRRAGDRCESDGGCTPAESRVGPDGLYTPALRCGSDGRCIEVPAERCNGLDDTGEGTIDEGCSLRMGTTLALPGRYRDVTVSRAAGDDRLALLLEGAPGQVLLLDESLTETARLEVPPGTVAVTGGPTGFVLRADTLRDDRVVIEATVLDREGRALRTLALPTELRGAVAARFAGDTIELFGGLPSALRTLDARTGESRRVLPVERGDAGRVHRSGDDLVLCDRHDASSVWVGPDGIPSEPPFPTGCGEVQSAEGPVWWTWSRGGFVSRWISPSERVSFATAAVMDLIPLLTTGSSDAAFVVFQRTTDAVVVHVEERVPTSYSVPIALGDQVGSAAVVGDQLVLIVTPSDGFSRLVALVPR